MEIYENVLSPWSEVDVSAVTGLSPRLDDLNGKTIGMYGDFMNNATHMLKGLELELKKRYPKAEFSYIQYVTETTRIDRDAEFRPVFEEWAAGVDCILSFYGAVPSSSLFLGYNSAYMEKLGKPTVMAVVPRTYSLGLRGAKGMGVPNLRIVQYPEVAGIHGHETREEIIANMADSVAWLADEVVKGLTSPLTEEEKNPKPPLSQEYAQMTFSGTAREISEKFYQYGWTNGAPIDIPTREAVEEMLTGTDLAADYVVGYLPPKMGCATVEKIAINAVMAGCLPTYMPVLIAAVQGVLNPRIYLEGWTCSQSTWGPVLTLSGQVVKDIGMSIDGNALSGYRKPNAALARAFGFLMMNIGGLRPGIEDLSVAGHEFRTGFAIADNPDTNPWGQLHEDFGFAKEDSAVTMFWPQEHRVLFAGDVGGFLNELCKVIPYGWEPGMCIIMNPPCARMFKEAGWTKQRIIDYVVEYARRPASEVDLAWLKNNSHPMNIDFPEYSTHQTRIFWSNDHMFAIVNGGEAGPMMTVYGGGGDHGGPSCTKIELPKNWDALVEKYKDIQPDYIDY